ncbi:hypothetical protein SAMN05192541_117115 [Bradyrhizobium arachidis]|nr:hypothetical protein SAMN05192541_117115 [Bradyrhizobium arachidis]
MEFGRAGPLDLADYLVRAAEKVRPLSRLRERAGERVSPLERLPERREPSPGASRRPLPQAGEVKGASRQRIDQNDLNYRASSISSWLCAFFTAAANQLWFGASLAKHLV